MTTELNFPALKKMIFAAPMVDEGSFTVRRRKNLDRRGHSRMRSAQNCAPMVTQLPSPDLPLTLRGKQLGLEAHNQTGAIYKTSFHSAEWRIG